MSRFADRLNALFLNVHPRDRGPHTLAEVAEAINRDGGTTVSTSYLSLLRSGQKTNPSMATIEALSKFFKVRPGYFFDTEYAAQMDRDLLTLARLRDSGVEKLAARAFDLSPENQAAVETMVEALRHSQGLPPDQSGLHDK